MGFHVKAGVVAFMCLGAMLEIVMAVQLFRDGLFWPAIAMYGFAACTGWIAICETREF